MEDEKLIALVEAKTELYNKSSPFYKLQSRKDALWSEIGRELNASGEMCRRRWLTLRGRYGREVRKANAPGGSTQVATQKGRKRGQSGPSNSEVDEKMMEAIEIFKNKWSTQTTMQIQQQQQSTSPAVQSFSTLAVSILNKMDEAKQARAIEKILQAVFEVQRGE